MQRRHTDPLHQQTPVSDVLARPSSVGPLSMASSLGNATCTEVARGIVCYAC